MIGPILLTAMFVLLGIVFLLGKGAPLIAGYNTMSRQKKEQYNATALCRFMGRMMFGLAFCMALWLLSDIWGQRWLLTAGFVLFFAIIAFMLVYTNTGNRFKQ